MLPVQSRVEDDEMEPPGYSDHWDMPRSSSPGQSPERISFPHGVVSPVRVSSPLRQGVRRVDAEEEDAHEDVDLEKRESVGGAFL